MNLILSCHASPASIVFDDWQLVRDNSIPLSSDQPLLLPLALWRQQRKAHSVQEVKACAVWLVPDDEFQTEIEVLLALPLIAVAFSDVWDGREYAIAQLLRRRYGYQGELRAIGEVQRDQLFHLQRCGFDSFHLQEESQLMLALKEIGGYCFTSRGARWAGARVSRALSGEGLLRSL
jgi:uncharacterized protein (DUF934 family)